MNKQLETLRNAKPGGLVVVMGKFFDYNFWHNSEEKIFPTLLIVADNDTKNGTYWVNFALSYDDKRDCIINEWVEDSFDYEELYRNGEILAVCEPTQKQYAAALSKMVMSYNDLQTESCKRKSEPREMVCDYSHEGIANYVAGADDINQLAEIFASAAFRIAYASDQFADSKERIVFALGNSDEYPLQVALVKEQEPLRNIQTEFEHACFMEIHGLATPKQIAFRNYCAELMGYYSRNKTLRHFSDISKKYGVTGLTREQFHQFRLDEPDWVEQQGTDYIDKIYEQVKARDKK